MIGGQDAAPGDVAAEDDVEKVGPVAEHRGAFLDQRDKDAAGSAAVPSGSVGSFGLPMKMNLNFAKTVVLPSFTHNVGWFDQGLD